MTLQQHDGEEAGTREVVIRVNINHNEADRLAEVFHELGWEEIASELVKLATTLELEWVASHR